METDKVISALRSKTRREILQILAGEPKTVQEVMESLPQKRVKIKYRESVYKALEKLVDAGLVDKYYEKEKGICYKLSKTRLEIDLSNGVVEYIQ